MGHAPFPDLVRRFYAVLEALDLNYFAYGGIAVGIWGDPRVTQDVDAVIVLEPDQCAMLLDALRAQDFDVPDRAAATFPIDGWLRATWRGRFADIALGRTPFDQSAVERRVRATVLGQTLWAVSAEDLVLYKLMAYRYKDLADAQAVVTRHRLRLDRGYLRTWAQEIAAHTGKFEVPAKLAELLEAADRS